MDSESTTVVILDGPSAKPTKMEWSEQKNIILCREVLAGEPYKEKERTVQRAKAWQTVADNLNKIHFPKFKVDKRSVREHLIKLVGRFKKKNQEEEKASGISPEPTELDILLEEISERMESSRVEMAEESDNKFKKIEREKAQAQDMRLKAMESMGETKRRLDENCGENGKIGTKRKRSSGSELVSFLSERAEQEIELRQKEVEVKAQQHNDMMEIFVRNQQQQQEQQQQQFMQMQAILAQQQQQQNQVLLTLLANKK